MEYLVNEKHNNQFFPGNCIYVPENYQEDWRELLEADENAWKLARLSATRKTASSAKSGSTWEARI